MIALVLATLMLTAKVSSDNLAEATKDVEAFGNELKTVNKDSPAIGGFISTLDRAVMKFNCAREDESCEAWRAMVLINSINLGACDKPGSCVEEKKFLGDKKSMGYHDLMRFLAAKSKMILDKKHAKSTMGFWKAVENYICLKVPGKCKAIR